MSLNFIVKTCFWYGESVGEQEFDGRIFHMYPPPLHGRSYEKSRKMSRDRTVDLKNDCNRNRECLESWAPSERTLKDAKSVTPSSKSVTHGHPHDSFITPGAMYSPALTQCCRLLAVSGNPAGRATKSKLTFVLTIVCASNP